MLVVQAVAALLLVAALAFHVAAVGFVGLALIVIATAFTGVTDEHRIGHAFQEALPFTALVVVFFAIVAVIHEQHLFAPVVDWVLSLPLALQPAMFYVANGALSAISDNVFVATVYISEVAAALESGAIDRALFDTLAIAVNTGTNLPSVATPNGQAAFLFLLTSALAPLIRLSYLRMVWMALPYTITVTAYRLARRHLLALRFPPLPALRTRDKVRSKSSCEFCSPPAPDFRVDRGCPLGSNGPGAGLADGLLAVNFTRVSRSPPARRTGRLFRRRKLRHRSTPIGGPRVNGVRSTR